MADPSLTGPDYAGGHVPENITDYYDPSKGFPPVPMPGWVLSPDGTFYYDPSKGFPPSGGGGGGIPISFGSDSPPPTGYDPTLGYTGDVPAGTLGNPAGSSSWWTNFLTGAKSANSGSYGNTLDWFKLIAGLVASRNKGSFRNVPLTPAQQQLFNWSLGRMMGLPNTSALAPYAMARATSSPKFDINAAMQGKPSYTAPAEPDQKSLNYWQSVLFPQQPQNNNNQQQQPPFTILPTPSGP